MRSLLLAAAFLLSHPLWAWGERGHHLICEAATRLVKRPDFRKFLQARANLLGHVCNIPDIYWRSLGPSARSGDATHFLNPEKLGFKSLNDVPLNLQELPLKVLNGDARSLESLLEELGSIGWRADQFFRLAVESGNAIAAQALPVNASEQSITHPFNIAVHGTLTNLGLLGHFVGDAAMPYHSTSNYDGYENGHGGIHRFYETVCLDEYDFTLITDVHRAAKGLRAKMLGKPASPLARMRDLMLRARADAPRVLAADQVLKPSTLIVGGFGQPQKVPAVRKAPATACAKFKPFIERELADAAAVLSVLFDDIDDQSKSPPFLAYKSYQYPLMPDFVPPDYLATLSGASP